MFQIRTRNGDIVLHHLATKGNPNLVTLLLQHPHDIGIRNEKGETSLLCAVQAGNEEVVDQLLGAGADPSASTTAGPEGEARRQLKLEIHENNRVRLQGRGRGGEIYIRRGYNVRKYGERFKRPLHFAAQKGHRNSVKILLNADVHASATTYHKRSTLRCD
jgi:ankyrin repeat protein